ncbi:hypothetical protein BDR04DRAFT_1102030 [Suillus decipiens]|nr:hypothetical protein BDR04DRAFT_1102030 [Suillus decipiens]
MTAGHLTYILNLLKKWLLRLARRSASLFFAVLSSLYRFVAGQFKFRDRRLITRFPSGVLPRSREDIKGSPICPSLLPPGQTRRAAAEEPPSPSDDPYTGSHSSPLRKGTAIPPLDANPTTMGYTTVAQTDGLHQGSASSLHLSLHVEESSVRRKTFPKDGALQESSSPGPSRLSGLHEVSTTHSRPRGYMDDTHSINTTRTSSMRHLAPGTPYSQYASDSRASLSTCHSITRSMAGSEARQAAYRTHKGPVYSRPISVYSTTGVVPLSDYGIDRHVHYTAPPGSNELPGSEVVMIYDGPQTSPMVASDVSRYERCRPRDHDDTSITISAMTMAVHDTNVPEGWTAFVHPEGARYFVNQETRTFTDMDICQSDICDDIEYFAQHLLDELQRSKGDLALDMKQVDLVVEPKCFDGESVICCYYFVNHRDRCLFWLDDFNPKEITSECKGVQNLSHAWLAIQAQYWKHWDYFPSLCPVTESIVNELKDMLMHVTCDHLTSLGSSAAFDAIELKDHLSVVDRIRVHSIPPANQSPTPPANQSPTPPTNHSIRQGHAAIVIGRIMYILTHNHFVNYHGEDCVRLDFEQSVHHWTYKPSPLMVILAPLLFFDPVAQVQALHKIFVDEVAHTARWNAFCSNFKGQLQDSNLLATVLLNANVGFLAINTVDRGGRDAIQLASYMSLVTSLGSIVLGLFFVSHDRTSGKNTAGEAAIFLGRLHNKKHGMEKLAIIYSLPKALLMWGMAFFFAAFSIDWWTAGDITSRTIVGAVTLVVLMMVLNSIILTKEGAKWSWQPTWQLCGGIAQNLSSRLASAWKKAMELGQIDPTDNPRSHTDAIDLGTFVGPSAEANALPSSDIPGSDSHENRNNSPIPPVPPCPPTASVDAPQQPRTGNFVLSSSDSCTNPGVLSGSGSLQQIRENTQMAFQFQDQPTPEARNEPDSAPLHFNTLPSSASEKMVETPADAPRHFNGPPTTILSENVVEEPSELEHPQPSPSTTPPPKIYARSATGECFRHAPGPPQSTLLEAGHDIVEEFEE